MATFKVIDTRRIPSADPSRMGKLDWLVTYQTDAMHTGIIVLTQDELTEEIIKTAVQKDLAATQQFTGKEFQL